MSWEVEYTDEFEARRDGLGPDLQVDVAAVVGVLAELGPAMPFPYSSDVRGSRHGKMRELRIQHRGLPYRVLYAFDPRRVALLLPGGAKAGGGRWYERMVPEADAIFDRHLAELSRKDNRNA